MVYRKKSIIKSVVVFTTFIVIVLFIALPLDGTGDDLIESLEVESHFISIEPGEKLEVDEMALFNYSVFYHSTTVTSAGNKKTYNGTLYMWFPEQSESLLIESYGVSIIYQWKNATTVSINLSENSLSIHPNKDIQFNVSYSSPSPFFKKFLYQTRSLRIEVAGKEYPQGNVPFEYNPGEDTYVSLLTQIEIPFTVEINFVNPSVSQWNSYSIFLLVLVVILSFFVLFLLRPQLHRLGKEPDGSLELRKKLAMESLRALETERKERKVPDAYYTSIRDDFKKEVVTISQELEKRNRK